MDAILWVIRKKYSDVSHISTESLAQWLSVPVEPVCGLHVQDSCRVQVNDGIHSQEAHVNDTSKDNTTDIRESFEKDLDSLVLKERSQCNCSSKSKSDSAEGYLASKGVVILFDVRSECEYEVSHLQGARRVDDTIDNEELTELLKECMGIQSTAEGSTLGSSLPNEATEDPFKIVCYCSLGYRSSDLARKIIKQLKNMHLSNPVEVYNLEGSIFKWANENRELIKSNGEKTKFVHPYNYTFGLTLREELRKYE
ncbi:uncharacterized protein [Panulirus ornatus]|uniref:uncharacterized protein n=1 Tax=Panulirus ornatus TaxID=150431 RepID=UPI003A8C6BDC